jgi:hypothetical protein
LGYFFNLLFSPTLRWRIIFTGLVRGHVKYICTVFSMISGTL